MLHIHSHAARRNMSCSSYMKCSMLENPFSVKIRFLYKIDLEKMSTLIKIQLHIYEKILKFESTFNCINILMWYEISRFLICYFETLYPLLACIYSNLNTIKL